MCHYLYTSIHLYMLTPTKETYNIPKETYYMRHYLYTSIHLYMDVYPYTSMYLYIDDLCIMPLYIDRGIRPCVDV